MSGEKEDPKIVVHVIFMMISWMFLTPIAITAAWHTKDVFTKPTIKSKPTTLGLFKPLWFNLHVFSNILATILTIVAISMAIWKYGDWESGKIWANFENHHETFGIVTFILVIALASMGLVRPSPNDSNRKSFNWIHGFFGFSCQIIAFITVYKGIEFWEWYGLSEEINNANRQNCYIIYFVEVGVFAAGFILLEILKRKVNRSWTSNSIEFEDDNVKIKSYMKAIYWVIVLTCLACSVALIAIILPFSVL